MRTEHNKERRGRERPKKNMPERDREMLKKKKLFVFQHEIRHERKRGDTIRKADHNERHRVEINRKIKYRDCTRRKSGSKRSQDEKCKLVYRQCNRARKRIPKNLEWV